MMVQSMDWLSREHAYCVTQWIWVWQVSLKDARVGTP